MPGEVAPLSFQKWRWKEVHDRYRKTASSAPLLFITLPHSEPQAFNHHHPGYHEQELNLCLLYWQQKQGFWHLKANMQETVQHTGPVSTQSDPCKWARVCPARPRLGSTTRCKVGTISVQSPLYMSQNQAWPLQGWSCFSQFHLGCRADF